MAPRDASPTAESSKRPQPRRAGGFAVGPAHLPDGTYRRRVQRIRKDLIHRATVKRAYAKVKAQEARNAANSQARGVDAQPAEQAEPASLDLHPTRQAMIDAGDIPTEPPRSRERRPRSVHRPNPFYRESKAAQQAREAAEAKRQAIAAAEKEKADRHAQRERWGREMAKARGKGKGLLGKRKLGRESKVLLEKVQRTLAREKDQG